MEKKQLKLRKETLTNLTNLNIREMEEVKGGIAQQVLAADCTIIVTVPLTVTITLPCPPWGY